MEDRRAAPFTVSGGTGREVQKRGVESVKGMEHHAAWAVEGTKEVLD